MRFCHVLAVFLTIIVNVALCENPKMIELVLDSSGSMNAKLPDGEKRINAAKKAVEKLIADLSGDTILAFRAYGHQSPRQKQDCSDTELLVPFGKLSDVKSAVMDHVSKLEPRGFTAITKALQLAAADFKSDAPGSPTIILVSDGKETCEGDPCVTARELQRSGVNLVVHTIGLGVDFATRSQLQCIAKATGGSYFNAEGADDLASVLDQAAEKEKITVQLDKGTGFLEIPKATIRTHKVIDATTGKEVASIFVSQPKVELPAGLYHVTFEKDIWKSIEVKAGETTVLNPGKLFVETLRGLDVHKVMNSETGKEHGIIALGSKGILLVPGEYEVTFGNIVWPSILVDAGKDTVIRPGVVTVKGLKLQDSPNVHTNDGRLVGSVHLGGPTMALPPGDYTIDIAGKKHAFTIEEGKLVEFSAK